MDQVSKILNLPNYENYQIIDSYKQLVLVHYIKAADKNIYGHLKGVLIDLESETILANSFGYTSNITTNKVDLEGIYKMTYEGVVIRVVWHNYEMLRITHKKINSLTSKWNKSKPFLEIYDQIGPKPEDLFDVNLPNSQICYHFMLCDRSLLVASQEILLGPYLINLVTLPELTLAQANHHLQLGHSITVYNDKITKINSEAYAWRKYLRGNCKLEEQFYNLLTECHNELPSYYKHYKLCHKHNLEFVIVKHNKLTREQRFQLVWLNYTQAMPNHLVNAAINLFNKFHSDRKKVKKWLNSQGRVLNYNILGSELYLLIKEMRAYKPTLANILS